jgi:hypothetical protein
MLNSFPGQLAGKQVGRPAPLIVLSCCLPSTQTASSSFPSRTRHLQHNCSQEAQGPQRMSHLCSLQFVGTVAGALPRRCCCSVSIQCVPCFTPSILADIALIAGCLPPLDACRGQGYLCLSPPGSRGRGSLLAKFQGSSARKPGAGTTCATQDTA